MIMSVERQAAAPYTRFKALERKSTGIHRSVFSSPLVISHGERRSDSRAYGRYGHQILAEVHNLRPAQHRSRTLYSEPLSDCSWSFDLPL